ELREMVNLPGTRPEMVAADFEGVPEALKARILSRAETVHKLRSLLTYKSSKQAAVVRSERIYGRSLSAVADLPRPRKRLTELLMKTAVEVPGDKELERRKNATKIWGFRFYRSPTEIFADPSHSRTAGIRLAVNRLEAVLTGEVEDVSCGLVISSIGYKSLPIDPSVPFDSRRAIVPNSVGRVHQAAGVKPVTFSDWEKIDSLEMRKGEACGKPREKLLTVNTLSSPNIYFHSLGPAIAMQREQ
ncbi:hypothetical protein GOODEAATRI_021550, partial [Goodea atripinnis]